MLCPVFVDLVAFSALTLLVGRKEGRPTCKKTEWWAAGVVICLEQGADLHMVQLMPLLLTVSCFSKIQIGFTFLVPAHPGSCGQRAVKRMCVVDLGGCNLTSGEHRVNSMIIMIATLVYVSYTEYLCVLLSSSLIGNERVPIQLAQCWWFPELAISNAKI